MKKGLVGIIVPCYNSGRYLSRAIESALAQSYKAIEIIVVDDGSTDNSAAVAGKFGNAIKYIYQPNRGVSAARNNGVGNSDAEFLQFLDADDVILPDKIARHVHYLDSHPDADLVFSELMEIDGDNERDWYPENWRIQRARDDFVEALAISDVADIRTILLRRSVFDRVNGFPEDWNHRGEDWYLWMKIALDGGRFHFLPGVTALYRKHPAQITAAERNIVEYEAPLLVEFEKIFQTRNIQGERRMHALALGFTRQARSLCFIGQIEKAREFLRKAELIRPKPALGPGNDPDGFAVPEGEWNLSLVYFGIAGDLYWGGMPIEGERLLQLAMNSGDLLDKLRLVDEFLDTGKFGVCLYPLARALAVIGQWDRYERVMKRIVQLHPLAVRPHNDLIKRFLKTGRLAKAGGHLAAVMAIAAQRLIFSKLNIVVYTGNRPGKIANPDNNRQFK